jgi:hypothetical protein
MVRNIAIAVLLLSILITAGCGNPPSQIMLTDSVNKASIKSANGLELSLSLDATTYKLYQDVSIVIDEKNTLSKTNRIFASDKWPFKGLTLGPCTQGSPFGVAVFSGYYSPADVLKGTPLVLFDPDQFYHCPAFSWAEGTVYEFKPSSDIAAIFHDSVPPSNGTDTQILKELQLSHYWTGSYPATIHSFEPGIYTIVAGDEWGALVVLHFTVTNTTTTSAFDPMNPGKVPEDKAIEIASAFVPHDALSGAMITTSVGIGNGQTTWVVTLNLATPITVTKEQLLKIGWQADNNTEFYSETDSYDQLMIVVDANTGVIVSKEAMTAIHLDGPTSTIAK